MEEVRGGSGSTGKSSEIAEASKALDQKLAEISAGKLESGDGGSSPNWTRSPQSPLAMFEMTGRTGSCVSLLYWQLVPLRWIEEESGESPLLS